MASVTERQARSLLFLAKTDPGFAAALRARGIRPPSGLSGLGADVAPAKSATIWDSIAKVVKPIANTAASYYAGKSAASLAKTNAKLVAAGYDPLRPEYTSPGMAMRGSIDIWDSLGISKEVGLGVLAGLVGLFVLMQAKKRR